MTLREALDRLEADGFTEGEGWHAAHDLAQGREGEPLYDRLHALLHRIEGDEANARYWYRRAGTAPFAGSIAEEWQALRVQS